MNKQGVLLVNLGSPNSPSVPDVRKYLREFLMDGRVLDAPYPIRWFVVHCCILPFRPKQSAEAYHKIWLPEGSPLIVTSKRLQTELQQRIDLPIELAMRYQNPSITEAVQRLDELDVSELLVIPLFPHYAMSSFETAVEQVKEVVRKIAPHMELRIAPPYYNQGDYIEALVASATEYLERDYDHLLFSFHGIPERHLHKSDPTGSHCLKTNNCCNVASPAHRTCYRAQCFKTVEAFVKRSGVRNYSVAFQSRLGKEPWLQPYTDRELVRLAQAGIRRLLIICPAFVADCLETIEELGMRGKAAFFEAGGEDLTLIPCLNDHPAWVAALEAMITRFDRSANSPDISEKSLARCQSA
jgi:ferrochelatase